MNINEFSEQLTAAKVLAQAVGFHLQDSIETTGSASLALAGGSTPLLFLQLLAQQDVEWEKVNVMPTDERQVPITHERSNARFLEENFLSKLPNKPNILFINDEASLDEVRATYHQQFNSLDVCVLGMGEDGHTASIFPNCDTGLLSLNHSADIETMIPDNGLDPRITLTMSALLKVHHIYLLIHGEMKKQMLNIAMSGDDLNQMPIRGILQNAGDRLTIYYANEN